MVDPGGDLALVRQAIASRGVKVVKVLLTHGHLDHVGGAEALAQQLQVAIEGPHADDAFWLELLPQQAQMMGFAAAQAFVPQRYLREGDEVGFGKLKLQVLHCPGHTPGHLVFFHEPSQLALVGDVLFKGAIGRTDFPRGNYDDLINSIRHKLWPLGDKVRFVPGHGPMSSFGEEREHNAFVADKRFG